jgi:hypothetical protein
MFLPGWFPAGASRVIPQFNLVEAGVDTADSSIYGRTFAIPNVRPDRYVVVLSGTGKNSGTTTIVSETLGGVSPDGGISLANSRTAVSIAYSHVPAGTSIEYVWNLNSSQTAWAFACFEVWGLHPSLLTASRNSVGNIAVKANGLLFAAAASGDPVDIANMTLLASNDGSDVSREVRYRADFAADQTFDVQAPGVSALVALSIR